MWSSLIKLDKNSFSSDAALSLRRVCFKCIVLLSCLTPAAGRWAQWWRGRCPGWWSGGTGRERGSREGWEGPPRSYGAQRTGRECRNLLPLCPGASQKRGGLAEGGKGWLWWYELYEGHITTSGQRTAALSPNIQRSRHSRQITSSCHTCSRPCWAVGSRQPWASSWKNFWRLNTPIVRLKKQREARYSRMHSNKVQIYLGFHW